jgi:hypothetical protein
MSETSRYEQLENEAKRYHAEHPEVWEMFCKLTRSRIRRGFQNYSARAIFHAIRWEKERPFYLEGEEFKLNDHHSPFYARWFMRASPEHAGFFRLRKQTSREAPASTLPPLGPADFPEGTDE